MADEGKVTCPVCNKEFKNKAGLLGHMKLKHPGQKAPETEGQKPGEPGTATVVKKGQSPLEVLVEKIRLPKLVDGHAEVFDAGVEYGVRSVLMGVRVAQELSAMGVQQAMPIIKMAQEMRESEGQAAKTIAAELAEATLEGNKDLRGAIGQLGSQITAASPNPLMSMMTNLMQPYMGQTMERLMKVFGGGSPGESPPTPAQPETKRKTEAPSAPGPGIEEHSIDEWED